MSGKRDWDKVRRDRQAYEHGTLPAWWDGWAAEPWEPAAPSILTGSLHVSEKRTLWDIDGTEFPIIGSWSKSAKAHIKALGLKGSDRDGRYRAIVQKNAAESSGTTDYGEPDGVRKAIKDRQLALAELVHAIREYRKIADSKPLTLQRSDYAHAVHELNKAIDRADKLAR